MSPARVTASENPLRDPRDKRLPRIAGPCSMVLFGVTGDLARKKLMPAIYDLANRGLLPPGFSLVGFARRDWADQDFGKIVYDSVRERARTPFARRSGAPSPRAALRARHVRRRRGLRPARADRRRPRRASRHRRQPRLLPVDPAGFFATVCQQLERSGLASSNGDAWRRVVIEKPFGHDLTSARELNTIVEKVFPADSVFRIDHYLGKETVQNLLALRFANQMFEPVWNANYVDHVQITMAEDIGIGGRAGYYDGIGAARDVIQNHLLQLLALTAMEEPVILRRPRCAPRRRRCSPP
jgi:glucose-6-phosphate 1-dehydrogenase